MTRENVNDSSLVSIFHLVQRARRLRCSRLLEGSSAHYLSHLPLKASGLAAKRGPTTGRSRLRDAATNDCGEAESTTSALTPANIFRAS